MPDHIINISDSNGYGKKRVNDAIEAGYKISSSCTTSQSGGGYYTVFVLVRKNWLERLLKL